jgi:hypothetical protein
MVDKLKREYPSKTKNFRDNQLAYIVHHQGADGAEYFFKNNFKVKPSENTDSEKELKGGLERIPDGDLATAISKTESHSPYIVYKGEQPSSGAGKYQVLVKSQIDDLRRYIDKNLDLINDEPTEEVQETGEEQPKVTGKFFSALQDSLKANQNFNVGIR